MAPRKKITHNTRTRRSRASETPARRENGFTRTREDHQLEQAEDYVELIASLTAETGEARAVDMARRLGVTHVTVTKTLGRLQKAGLIKTEPYRAVFLTESGSALAAKAKARHRIVLDFLVAAGVSPKSAALDAEGIEHHVSPETLAVLAEWTRKMAEQKS